MGTDAGTDGWRETRAQKGLTDTAIRKAKPRAHRYRIADTHGLSIEISPASTDAEPRNFWRYRYRIDGKENLFAAGEWCQAPIGEAPDAAQARRDGGRLTLQEARRARVDWRAQVKRGEHPRIVRKAKRLIAAQSAATTFRAVTEEFVERRGGSWGPDYRRNFDAFMERDAFPAIGDQPIAKLLPVHLLAVLQKVEARGAVTVARHGRSYLSSVFRYAVATLKVPLDPMPSLRGALAKRTTVNHPTLARIDIGPFLRAIREKAKPGRSLEIAVELLLMTMLRTVELRGGQWTEIDWGAELWRIPPERMKKSRWHFVPLPRQALALLRELQEISGTGSRMFPNVRDPRRPMAAETLRRVFERAGYSGIVSPHGFRGTSATLMREEGFASELVELQLAHQDRNRSRAAYDHATLLEPRRQMLQWWADLVDAECARVLRMQHHCGARMTSDTPTRRRVAQAAVWNARATMRRCGTWTSGSASVCFWPLYRSTGRGRQQVPEGCPAARPTPRHWANGATRMGGRKDEPLPWRILEQVTSWRYRRRFGRRRETILAPT